MSDLAKELRKALGEMRTTAMAGLAESADKFAQAAEAWQREHELDADDRAALRELRMMIDGVKLALMPLDESITTPEGVTGHSSHVPLGNGLVRCECGDVGDPAWLRAHVDMRRALLGSNIMIDRSKQQ